MNHLIVGNVAYLTTFDGNPEELYEVLGEEVIRGMLIEGITRIVWGAEGEEWVYIDQVFRPEPVVSDTPAVSA